jgi:hypothetical protein
MLIHSTPLQPEKLADFCFGSAKILGEETGVLDHSPGQGKGAAKGPGRAERALPCYSWLGAMLARPAVARALEHDPEKWIPVFGKDHAPAKT